MTASQRYAIEKWNYDRGTVFNFDIDLEVRMLNEEHREFLHAYYQGDIVGMLDAIADLEFVLAGTCIKNKFAEFNAYYDLVMIYDSFWRVYNFYDDIIEAIKSTMLESIKSDNNNIFNDVLDIVIEANQQKTKATDGSGKILKPDGFVGPEEKIEQLLRQRGIL